MKRPIIFLLLPVVGIIILLSACTRQAALVMRSEGATATAQAAYALIAEDVPMMAGAVDLTVTGKGTYITYQVPGPIENVISYYQQELVAQGWQQRDEDRGFGDSITLLRFKEDKNISVTIQAIAGSDYIRVLITLPPK